MRKILLALIALCFTGCVPVGSTVSAGCYMEANKQMPNGWETLFFPKPMVTKTTTIAVSCDNF